MTTGRVKDRSGAVEVAVGGQNCRFSERLSGA